MRILWIGPWHADKLCAQIRGYLAQAIHDVGNEIGTVVIGERGCWKTGGYDWIHYCPPPRSVWGKCANQARMSCAIAGFKGDVLVLGEKVAHLAPVAAVLRTCYRRKWKIVIDVRTLACPSGEVGRPAPREKLFWRQLRTGFPHVDGWMAITDRLREAVAGEVDTRGLPCGIWESAVDRELIENEEIEPSRKIAECGHERNILYLGDLEKGRRLDLAVRAIAELKDPSGKVGLHIVGSGNQMSEIERLVAELRVENTVHIWGPIPYSEVPSTILACELGILPLPDCDAWNTSSPLKLFEYMGLGTPILVSDIPAHRDAVDGQPFAFFMDEYSTKGFNEALTRFLACSEVEYRELRKQAKEFVRAGHTWDHRAQVIHHFLTSIQTGKD